MSENPAAGGDILLVEDDRRDAELMVRAIRQRVAKASLHVVRDGAEALDFIFGRGGGESRALPRLPKVVFLDLKLPRVAGLDVLDALRRDDRTRAIPVVVVTSSRQDGDIRAAYARGVNSYVVKPVDFDALMDTIGSVGAYWLTVNLPHR